MMKALKPLVKTFFSETMLAAESSAPKSEEKAPPAPSLIDFDEKTDSAEPVEKEDWNIRSGVGVGWHGGLGQVYKYPGDPKKLRERSKMKLWKDYCQSEYRIPAPYARH